MGMVSQWRLPTFLWCIWFLTEVWDSDTDLGVLKKKKKNWLEWEFSTTGDLVCESFKWWWSLNQIRMPSLLPLAGSLPRFICSLTQIDLQSVILVFKNPIKSKKPMLVYKTEPVIASSLWIKCKTHTWTNDHFLIPQAGTLSSGHTTHFLAVLLLCSLVWFGILISSPHRFLPPALPLTSARHWWSLLWGPLIFCVSWDVSYSNQ